MPNLDRPRPAAWGPAAELAELLSRIALLLITTRLSLARMDAIGAGMDLLVTSLVRDRRPQQAATHPYLPARGRWSPAVTRR
ncbi:MAG: hypothetical protein ACREX8_03695 [Gammaproteobacteria bacterium]